MDNFRNPKHDGYQRGFAAKVYKFFDKKLLGGGVESDILPDQQLPYELYKLIIRKFEKRRVH